jgi:hypothetical protein
MELDLDLQSDAETQLYFDVLVLYLLVESALGDCSLLRRIGQALESGEGERLAAELDAFEALPEEQRTRIVEGDPTLSALLEGAAPAREDAPAAAAHPASA